jgi:hypothetical protein
MGVFKPVGVTVGEADVVLVQEAVDAGGGQGGGPHHLPASQPGLGLQTRVAPDVAACATVAGVGRDLVVIEDGGEIAVAQAPVFPDPGEDVRAPFSRCQASCMSISRAEFNVGDTSDAEAVRPPKKVN